MGLERTLAIIKPDAVEKGLIGHLIRRFEESGFAILAMKMVRLPRPLAEEFYAAHRNKAFYSSLTEFMSSGPCIALVLEAEDVIRRYRELMGATDPALAAPGSIRREYGSDIEHNVVHGSDSLEAAAFEIPFFFSAMEIIGRT